MMKLRKARGFTLIELLAVIAMVMVLSAVLLPCLRSTDRCRRRTACGSNLSQIAKGLYIYSTTYHCYPTTATGSDPFAVTGSALPSLNLLYAGYINDIRVFRCPTDPTPVPLEGIVPTQNGRLQDGGAGMVSSYGYDPGHNPEDERQDVVAVAADRKGKGKNSDNHSNRGQNIILGQGTIEWRDTVVNNLGKDKAGRAIKEDDIYSLDDDLPRELDSYVRQ